MSENNQFKLDNEVFIDTKSTSEDGGKQTYWIIEYKQRKQLLNRINELVSENEKLKKENKRMINKEFELVKYFAESKGISIMAIPTAFKKCWNDNAKLVDKIKGLENNYIDEYAMNETLRLEVQRLQNENERMTNKLNELALEFLNYDIVTMGKATEISEMCYHDFLKYRAEHGNPMELQL